MPKSYLGDGAYVDFDGYALILTAEDGINVSDRIVLEPSVYVSLVEYVEALKRPTAPVSSYILRKIDPQLWQQVKAKAALEKITLRELIKRYLEEWVKS